MIKLLDWERALENADGSEELLIELAKVFIESCPEMMRQVRDAVDRGDAQSLQRAAHNIKGSARVFASGGAMEEAMRLESMGADGDLSAARQSLAILENEVTQLTEALGQKISQSAPGARRTP